MVSTNGVKQRIGLLLIQGRSVVSVRIQTNGRVSALLPSGKRVATAWYSLRLLSAFNPRQFLAALHHRGQQICNNSQGLSSYE